MRRDARSVVSAPTKNNVSVARAQSIDAPARANLPSAQAAGADTGFGDRHPVAAHVGGVGREVYAGAVGDGEREGAVARARVELREVAFEDDAAVAALDVGV